MASFDQLVDQLIDLFGKALAAETTGRELRWLGLGAEEEGLYFAFRTDAGTGVALRALLDLGFGTAESEIFDIADDGVVDFDAADYEGDYWDGRDFIIRCALAFAALGLEEELGEDAHPEFAVDVFDALDTPRVPAPAPTYFGEMPVGEFLAEFEDHCDDQTMAEFARRACEGWTGGAMELARQVSKK